MNFLEERIQKDGKVKPGMKIKMMATGATFTVLECGIFRALGMEMLVIVGMGMVMLVGMAVLMVMSAAKMIVVNMHIVRSFAFFYHYSHRCGRCQSIYFTFRTPVGACVMVNFAV